MQASAPLLSPVANTQTVHLTHGAARRRSIRALGWRMGVEVSELVIFALKPCILSENKWGGQRTVQLLPLPIAKSQAWHLT